MLSCTALQVSFQRAHLHHALALAAPEACASHCVCATLLKVMGPERCTRTLTHRVCVLGCEQAEPPQPSALARLQPLVDRCFGPALQAAAAPPAGAGASAHLAGALKGVMGALEGLAQEAASGAGARKWAERVTTRLRQLLPSWAGL